MYREEKKMRSRKLGRKLLSGTLALGLCVTMTPFVSVTAVAAAGGEETPAVTAEPGAPELAVTGGNTWNGTDDIRVYVNADDSIAVDDMSNLVIAEGGDKYEIVDGHLKLKDGMTAENGDTITIQTEVNYYTEDQLLWSDGLETDNSQSDSVYRLLWIEPYRDNVTYRREIRHTCSAEQQPGWSMDSGYRQYRTSCILVL